MSGVLGATDSVVRGLAVDLAPIRVNSISPGLVRTEVSDANVFLLVLMSL